MIINSADPTDVTGTAANFHGIFSPYAITGEDKTLLYLGYDDTNSKSTLYYPSEAMTINAFRAYFTLNGITAGESSNARAFVLNFGDGETSGIVDAEANSCVPSVASDQRSSASLFTLHPSLSTWYDMQGRRLSGKPTAKGLYISNGRKVYVK